MLLPLLAVNELGMGDPFFCKYLCPQGVLEGAIPLSLTNAGIRAALGKLFTWKAGVLLAVVLLWVFGSNRLVLTAVHPQLASSRGVATKRNETLFTVAIAIVVTLAMSWVGLMVINSLLVLPAAASRNLAWNLRQYHLLSVLSALVCGLLGLCAAYWLGCSAGATIALLLAVYFAVSFALRNRAA